VPAETRAKHDDPVPKASSTPCPFRLGKPAAFERPLVLSIGLSAIGIQDASQWSGCIGADRRAGDFFIRGAPAIGRRFAMPEPMGGPVCDVFVQARGWRTSHPLVAIGAGSCRAGTGRRCARVGASRILRGVRWQSVEGEQQAKSAKAPKQPCVDDGLATVGRIAPGNPNAQMWSFSLTARPASGLVSRSGAWIDDLRAGRLFSGSRPALISN
jgi:hypothetical protein